MPSIPASFTSQAAPFIIGQNNMFQLMSDNEQVYIYVVKWSVKPAQTKFADDIGGEDRSRLGVVTNYYDISADGRIDDTTPLEALLKRVGNESVISDHSNGLPLGGTVNLLVLPPKGGRVAFVGREISIDDWSWTSSGRSDRNTLEIPIRARYFEKAPPV